ncbi:hypothetical protein [Laspinema olomoucense]|uniref:hypothetical protein n=1 Tax=Laspinema olomoucense TaxID=3231600 RepID=UPI0021BB722D|nr:hypothetical protein [Laspinema sp. D3d]MCT7973658.1 hypothetical protein [Laspinema sp. D3d]
MAPSFQEIGQPIPSSKEWLVPWRRSVNYHRCDRRTASPGQLAQFKNGVALSSPEKNGPFLCCDRLTATELLARENDNHNWPPNSKVVLLPMKKMAHSFEAAIRLTVELNVQEWLLYWRRSVSQDRTACLSEGSPRMVLAENESFVCGDRSISVRPIAVAVASSLLPQFTCPVGRSKISLTLTRWG